MGVSVFVCVSVSSSLCGYDCLDASHMIELIMMITVMII